MRPSYGIRIGRVEGKLRRESLHALFVLPDSTWCVRILDTVVATAIAQIIK